MPTVRIGQKRKLTEISRRGNRMNPKVNLSGKRVWLLSQFMVIGLAATYLFLVFMAAFSKSTRYEIYAKSGQTLPEMSNEISQECKAVFKATTLTPYFESAPPHIKHDHPEFKEYATVWLLDSAETIMYDATLLDHPACLGFILKRLSVVENRQILVIYDRASSTEALVIKNYH